MCMDETLRRIGASDELKAMLKDPMFVLADTMRNTEATVRASDCPMRAITTIARSGPICEH